MKGSTPKVVAVGAAAFAAEIVLWAAVYVAVRHAGGSGPVGVAMGLAALGASLFAWGRWMSPQAPNRLSLYARIVLVLVVTAILGFAFIAQGRSVWPVVVTIFGVLYAVTAPFLSRALTTRR